MQTPTDHGLFVGRERELAELSDALDAAQDGRGGLCLLVGEAGVGKTSLAERLCAQATRRGVRVARGPCWDAGGAPAYWPWIQILRTLARDDPEAATPLGRGAADLARLVPELGGRMPAGPAPAARSADAPTGAQLASDERRFALFDAVGAWLVGSCAAGPVVALVEDLHAADEGSLLLLSFLAQQLHDTPLLIVATQRDMDGAPEPAIAALLVDVARLGRRIVLSGLRDGAVAELIAARAGAPVGEQLLRSVQRVTQGNPFFVDEIVRVLVADGLRDELLTPSQMPLPDSVRGALATRFAPLDGATRELLELAAVAGARFSVALLAESARLARAAVLERLEAGELRRMVRADPDVRDRFEFTHALVRETLYRGLQPARRMQLHREVAEALEHLHGAEHEEALAFHYMQAAAVAPAKAALYARRAGERAARQLAYEDAARHFAAALAVLESADADDRERCELLLALGAQQRRAGPVADARATFGQAAALARALPAPRLLARAALGEAGALGGPGLAARTDESLVGLLEEALEAIGPDPSAERAQLLARLALELYYTPDPERRATLSREAVRIADACGDTRSRLIATYSLHWSTLGPDRAAERRRAADELLALARGSDDLEMRFSAHHFRLAHLLEQGDIAGVDAELSACRALADTLHQPLYRWQCGLLRAMRALLQGHAEEGQRLALEAFEAGRVVDEQTAANLLAAQLFCHHWIAGRLDELSETIDEYAAQRPWIPTWRCAAAFLRTEIGDAAGARAELDGVGAHGFDGLPRDGNWAMGVALAGLAAAAIGAREHAAALYELVAPVAERVVVIAAGDVSIGPMALPAATLAATLGRWEEAEAHFAVAAEVAARLDARPAIALAHRERARMLAARGRRGDHAVAAQEARRGIALGGAIGMTRMVAQCRELLAALPDDPGPAERAVLAATGARPPARRARRAVLERDAEVWRVGREPDVTLLRDSKGLRCLATLLAAPRMEFHVLALVEPPPGAAEEELEPALAALAVERARVNVTRALRAAIRRIGEHDPALGRELSGAIRTGAVVRYEPGPAAATAWRVRP